MRPIVPIIEGIENDLFGCYILKVTNIKDTISGIVINEELCSKLNLTINDKFAAIAHEIGHIMFYFLENKQTNEELKADEFACKIGLSAELSGLLQKIKDANIYDEGTKKVLSLRLKIINSIYLHNGSILHC